MALDLVTMVFVSLFAVVVLVVLFFMLAMRYDQVVSAAGPQLTKEELEAQIEVKRQALADIDKQLEDRSKAMESVAGLEAEIDALKRQRDELLAEHANLSDRKEEVRQMDRETEEAVHRYAEAKRDLNEKEEALSSVQTKLERAETMVNEIDRLQNETDGLRSKVEGIRTELGDLRQLTQDEMKLRVTVEDLRREVTRLEGGATSAAERLQSVTTDLAAAESRRAESQAILVEASTRSEVAASEARRLEEENERHEGKARRLEAQIARLKAEADADVDGAPADERILSDLRAVPVCLEDIWSTEQAVETETDALTRVERLLEKSGMFFSRRTLDAFHTSLKTAVISPLTVLAGISGTGKSQLPRRYADAMPWACIS